jgi:hypothetical protein
MIATAVSIDQNGKNRQMNKNNPIALDNNILKFTHAKTGN